MRLLLSPIYDFWVMSGFEPIELDKKAHYQLNLATHPFSMQFYRRVLYYSFLRRKTSLPSPSFSVRTFASIPPILFFLFLRILLLFL